MRMRNISIEIDVWENYDVFDFNFKEDNEVFSNELLILLVSLSPKRTSTLKVTTADEGKKNHCYFSVY